MIRKNIILLLFILISVPLTGCSSFQTTKNVWKGTKGLWATYVSPPASVDYEDKGDLSPQALALSNAMIGVDVELGKLERVMQNADRPPTAEWLERLFQTFSWINGFAGIKYDGTILGQEPANSLKDLDFNYLLYEDSKQKSRALRADVQPSPLGPEIMLASPLYDGTDFLGIVVAYFDMRSLMGYSNHAQDIVVLCPTALLWPGKYDFASTPLAGVDWEKVVRESAAGTCSNANGTFFYMVRYLGNLPLVFAVPEKGEFQEGNGGIEQGFAFFPKEREKSAPPPVSGERRERAEKARQAMAERQQAESAEYEGEELAQEAQASASGDSNELQPGSRDSVLLKGQGKARPGVQERQLEGENVPVERPRRTRRPARVQQPAVLLPEEETLEIPDVDSAGQETPQQEFRRPSPFGPRETQEEQREFRRPSPFGPARDNAAEASDGGEAPKPEPAPESSTTGETAAPAPAPAPEQAPERPTLPGGRPSPFGPRN